MQQNSLKQKNPHYFVDIGNTSCVVVKIALGTLGSREVFYDRQAFLDWLSGQKEQVVWIASVCPSLDIVIQQLGLKNLYFIHYLDIPLKLDRFEDPSCIGIDRLLGAFGAYHRYKRTCLIVDSGSAITLCKVSQTGVYEGGVIVPGLEMAAKALDHFTDKVPKVALKSPKSLLGTSTEAAVHSGLVYGLTYLLNGFIAACKKQDSEPLCVLATGQGLELIEDELDVDAVEPDLVFEGMKALLKPI